MPLTAKDAFKVGFLSRCVEDGLSPDQMLDRVKQASDMLDKSAFFGGLIDKGYDLGKGILGGAMSYGVPAALAAPPILGGVAGYGLAKATDIDDTDVADIKDREVIDEYQRQTQKLLRQQAVKEHQRQQKGPTIRPLV